MSEIIPAPIPSIINKGRSWIAHGDNVITLPKAQKDSDFLTEATIYLPLSDGTTTRGPTETNPMTITTRPDTTTRLKVKLHGGFGFTSGGENADIVGTTQRFDDVANTWTPRKDTTARAFLAGFSLNGFGFASCGQSSGDTERFDDVANTWTTRTNATMREGLTGFATNEYFINFITENI